MRRTRLAAAAILIPAALAMIPAVGQATISSPAGPTPTRHARPFAHATETRIPTRAEVYERLHEAMSAEIAAYQEDRSRLERIREHAIAGGDVESVRRIELMAMQARTEHLRQLDELRRVHAPWLRPMRRTALATRPSTDGPPSAPADARATTAAPAPAGWNDLQANARQRAIDAARRRVDANGRGGAVAAGPVSGSSLYGGVPAKGGSAALGFSVDRGHLQRARERADRHRVQKRRTVGAG